MKLGTLLLRNAAIGLSQLEAALRNQVLYGGRLGTNLVELGFIDLELLSAYLAELTGFTVATATMLDNADAELVARLGSDLAHQYRAIPLGYVGEGTDCIAVAFENPADTEAVDRVGDHLGLAVTPFVVPELRALYYLEKLFGMPRRARFLRMARPGSEGDATTDRRRVTPVHGTVLPPAFTLEPRRRRSSSQLRLEAVSPTVSYGAACERIDIAPHREQIADALVDYGKGRCDALVVFLVRDGNALGWRGWVAPPARIGKQIDQVSLPLAGASVLQSAHDSGEAFVGASPATARPIETQLWTALGVTPDPAHLAVIPVLVKQRAVNLIYAHSLGGPIAPAVIAELTDLAARAQASYLRLIKLARGS